MEAQLKGAVLIALVVVPQWRCPILKPLSANCPLNPPKSETAPHPGWQDGTILVPGMAPLCYTSIIFTIYLHYFQLLLAKVRVMKSLRHCGSDHSSRGPDSYAARLPPNSSIVKNICSRITSNWFPIPSQVCALHRGTCGLTTKRLKKKRRSSLQHTNF